VTLLSYENQNPMVLRNCFYRILIHLSRYFELIDARIDMFL
jgi:hypothetical protein